MCGKSRHSQVVLASNDLIYKQDVYPAFVEVALVGGDALPIPKIG